MYIPPSVHDYDEDGLSRGEEGGGLQQEKMWEMIFKGGSGGIILILLCFIFYRCIRPTAKPTVVFKPVVHLPSTHDSDSSKET